MENNKVTYLFHEKMIKCAHWLLFSVINEQDHNGKENFSLFVKCQLREIIKDFHFTWNLAQLS